MPDTKTSGEKYSKKPRAPRKVDARYLENAALYYLQRYATSSQNLKNVLKRKVDRSCRHHGMDVEEFYPLIDKLVSRYCQTGLLDDAVYAQGRVNALRRQGLSGQNIRQKLALKGLDAQSINAALAQHQEADGLDPSEAERAAAERLAKRKKIGPYRGRPLRDDKEKNRETGILARAGFSFDIVRQVLQQKDLED